ncbi:NADH dehydrogenase (ubiquinone) complex I, assembly factor 6 [Centruroides vittatus]|uniref:NADH dehydrogenase (ubiquinone) complex I, assembly factor 6 n=1 Tax=Centruroides vittatus TaxID=120091 RepID=UPI0035106419
MMRIQFWKDTVDKIYQGYPPQQPIALELFRVIQCQKLSKHWFSRLIESRERSLHNTQYQVMSDVEQYAEESVSSIFYLLLQANGVNSLSCDHAASHLGKCQGILNLIRSVPYNASKRRVDIPIQELIKHDVSQEDIIRGRRNKNITDMIYEIASVANQHLQMTRSLKNKIPKNTTCVFLPAIVCDDYLKRLQREDFNVFSPKLTVRNNKLPLVLWWKKFLGKY